MRVIINKGLLNETYRIYKSTIVIYDFLYNL